MDVECDDGGVKVWVWRMWGVKVWMMEVWVWRMWSVEDGGVDVGCG